jgi:serine/threonine protein kinase
MTQMPPIREIFANALEFLSEEERKAYLDKTCAGAPEVRRRVDELLRAYMMQVTGFMEKGGPRHLASDPDPNRTSDHDSAGDTPGRGHSQSTPADPNRTSPHAPAVADREAPALQTPVEKDKSRVGETIGGYTLVSKLGDGGMGTVYLGEKRDGQDVFRAAIKLIKPDRVSPHLVARFKAERRVLTRLNHGNVAKVYDMGVHLAGPGEAGNASTHEPYFVMEYVAIFSTSSEKDLPALTFDDHCATHCLAIRQRLALFESVCRGVEHAHSSGVIHRDLKGSNILVAVPRNGQPEPKVIDFGLAKALEEPIEDDYELTSPGTFMGTPAYVSPEQASGEAGIGPATDVYALGVILYKLLTGTLPIDLAGVRGQFEMVKRIRDTIPLYPSAIVTKREASLPKVASERQIEPSRLPGMLRGDLDWVVMKALEKDPAHRYPTAGALALEIRRYLDGQPVEAGPDGRWHQFRKFVRRNRVLVTASGLAFLALLIGTVGLAIGLVQAHIATNNETAAKLQAMQERDRATEAEEVESKALAISWGGMRSRIRAGEALDEDNQRILRNMQEELRHLIREGPDASRKVREMAAETSSRLANLAALTGNEEAKSLYDEAIRKYERLSADFPGDSKFPNELARCHFDRAHLDMQNARLADAATGFRAAIELFQKVVASSPDVPAYHRELADAWNDLGIALKRDGKLSDAERAFEKAIEEGEKAVSREPGQVSYRIDLAKGFHNLGNVIRDQGKPKEAVEVYRKATTLLRPLALGYPEGGKSKEAARVLVDTCWDRANARGQLGLHAQALGDWTAAYQLNEIFKFHSMERLARFRAAAEMETKILAKPLPAAELYLVARHNARAYHAATEAPREPSLEKYYAARTLDLLRQARDAGYFRGENEVAALAKDPEFAVLPRDLITTFLAEPKAPSVPKK